MLFSTMVYLLAYVRACAWSEKQVLIILVCVWPLGLHTTRAHVREGRGDVDNFLLLLLFIVFSPVFVLGTMPGRQEKFSLGFLGSAGIESQNPNFKPLILLGEMP